MDIRHCLEVQVSLHSAAPRVYETLPPPAQVLDPNSPNPECDANERDGDHQAPQAVLHRAIVPAGLANRQKQPPPHPEGVTERSPGSRAGERTLGNESPVIMNPLGFKPFICVAYPGCARSVQPWALLGDPFGVAFCPLGLRREERKNFGKSGQEGLNVPTCCVQL